MFGLFDKPHNGAPQVPTHEFSKAGIACGEGPLEPEQPLNTTHLK